MDEEKLWLTSAEVVLQKTALSFDASVWKYSRALVSGARLVLANAEGIRIQSIFVGLSVGSVCQHLTDGSFSS